jgi:hypothetical protein
MSINKFNSIQVIRTSHVSRQNKPSSEDNFETENVIQEVEKSSLSILKIEQAELIQ